VSAIGLLFIVEIMTYLTPTCSSQQLHTKLGYIQNLCDCSAETETNYREAK